jgi:transcriptional regulator with XRE-family HTH domain
VRLRSKASLVRKLLESKKAREAYVFEHVRNGVPFQIRTMREERKWTQGDLGNAAGKPRNVITRLEDPNYGKLTLKTLFEIASAFDVALLVKFVPFTRLLREYEDVSPSALSASNIHQEAGQLKAWAAAQDKKALEIDYTETAGSRSLVGINGGGASQPSLSFDRHLYAVSGTARDIATAGSAAELEPPAGTPGETIVAVAIGQAR